MWMYVLVGVISFFIGFFSCAILSISKESDAYKKGLKEGKRK
ncbi:MAG: hypothetical protein ACQESN_10780 [Thermotogota bacterium]